MTKVDEQVADARRQTMEAEAVLLHALASLRASLNELEEENRRLQHEVAKQQIEIFTEEEFAEKLKVDRQLIGRLRREGRIEPLMIGACIRYSSVDHLAKVGELFGPDNKVKRFRKAS